MSRRRPPVNPRILPPFATPFEPPRSARNEKNRSQGPLVTVFGAGIAGLSTAHELIERGFSVQVVEPARSPDEEYAVEAGGMARNQFGRIPEDPRILHGPEPVTQRPVDWQYTVFFQPKGYVIADEPDLKRALADLVKKLAERDDELAAAEADRPLDWLLMVRGHGDRSDGDAMGASRERVHAVVQFIHNLADSKLTTCRFRECPLGDTLMLGPQEDPANYRVELELENPLTAFREEIEKVWTIRPSEMNRVQPRFPTPERILFEIRGSVALDPAMRDDWDVPNETKLVSVWQTLKRAYLVYKNDYDQEVERTRRVLQERFAEPCDKDWTCREILFVEVRGHTDGDGEEALNRKISKQRAQAVINRLKFFNNSSFDRGPLDPKLFDLHFRAVGVGSAEPIGDQRSIIWRRRSNRVEIRIVERLIPGEHGYRFFPAFYRHLFDTMRRTPLLDERFEETGHTAYDSLEPVADAGIAVEDGQDHAILETRPVRSLEELRRLSELFFRRLGVTQRDIVRFQTRLLKFLTSSSIRRKQEYEKESWWRFIGGDSERGYSPRMAEYLKETPQALIAMNAEETDARSQGNIVCQLQLHYLKNQFDRSLNGPTTRVWIRQWKRYLKRQGVRFFVGELGKLEWCRNELIPITTSLSAWLEEPPAREPAQEAPAAPPVISAIGVKVAPSLPAAPAPAASRPSVLIEVLDNDDGEYAILIAGKPYCFTARGHSREDIAECLARAINQRDPDVVAEVVSGTPGDPEAWPKGRTRIQLMHRIPDDGVVKIGGDICDAQKLVITYSDGPTPKERPVRVVQVDAFVPTRGSRENAGRVVNDSIYAVEILESWERTRNRTNSGTKSRQLLTALVNEVLHPPATVPKAPARTAKGKPPSGRSSLEDALNDLLEGETRREARAAVMHFVNERFMRDLNAAVSLAPPDCQPDLRRLLADLIWAAHSSSQIETRVQRFLEEREPMRRLKSKESALIHHFAGRLARAQDNDISFLYEVVLDDEEWGTAGVLRMTDEAFAKQLLEIEKRQRSLRPLAPRIDVRSARGELDIRFLPPDLLSPSNDPCARKSYTHILKAMPFGSDLQITDALNELITTSSPWILDHRYTWIVVRNADENLRIITEPTPENPDEDYQSHEEERAAFRPDFYVLALPFDTASTLVWRAEQERPGGVDGCLSELLDFDRNAYRRTPRGKEVRLIRDPHGRPPKLYPLRDFSGIQYYFHNQVRIGRGHLYFPQAEWGLSSISQLAYWRERMSPTSPFLGQLSVDIGAFYRPAERLGSGRIRPSAWHSTTTEIAEEVWRQVRESMDFLRASVLAPPDYFHLDQWLRFDDRRGSSFRNNAYIRITGGFPRKCDVEAPGLIEHGLLDWRSSLDLPIPPGRMDEPWGDYVVWVNGEPYTVRVSSKNKDSYELCSYEYTGGERRLRQCTTYPRNGLLPVDDAKSQHLGNFTNQTTAANSSNPGDVIAFEDTAGTNDAFYIGFGKQFVRLAADRVGGKKGTGTANTVWEYSRGGGSWKPLQNVKDPTGSVFGTEPLKNGERIEWDLPFDWKPVRVRNGPPLYYVRVRVTSGSYTQGPVLSRLSTDGFVNDSATLRHRIACHLAALINNSPCGSLHAGVYQEFRIITNPCHPGFDPCAVERREIGCPTTQLEVCSPGAPGATPFHTEVDDKAPILLYVQSKVPTNGALICIEGSSPGNYEIWIGEKRFCNAQTSVVTDTHYARKAIRDALFAHLSCHSDIPVIAELSGDTGIVLLPKAAKELPHIRVHNENQQLDLIFGDMLHIRLEQCHQHLSFEDPEKATIGYNLTPFLINVPNQWQYRPGVRPSGGRMSMTVPVTHASQTDIFYRVSNQRWVGAGTYMATTTRLTTMEAANESARHAVNAILHTLVQPGTIYNSQGKMLAEFAEIWDPERFELDDLEPLKRLDEKLANEGLPHVLDILKLIEAVDAIPMHGKATDDPLSNITHLLQHASEDFNKDWGFTLEALYGIIGKAAEQANNLFDPLGILRGTGGGLKGLPADLVERIQRALRAFMEGAGGNPSGGARS